VAKPLERFSSGGTGYAAPPGIRSRPITPTVSRPDNPRVKRLPERIEAEGLRLRCWRVNDAERLHRAVSESAEHLRQWMAWMAEEPQSMEQRREDEYSFVLEGKMGALLGEEVLVASAGVPRRLGYELVGTQSDEAAAPADTGTEFIWRLVRGQWSLVSA